MSHPFTDVVIPVHNALSDLKECLVTVQQYTVDCRLILVDDCSEWNTTEFLYDFGKKNPSCIIMRTNRQRWFTRASNLGLKIVRTERSVLLNSDCVVDSGWLEELFDVWAEFQQQNPQRKIGLVGSVLSAEEPRRYAEIIYPGFVTGHCLLLSIPALFEISAARGMPGWYLNEVNVHAAHIHSDRDCSWELQKLGYATIASFKSAVGHKFGRSWHCDLGAIPRSPQDPALDMNR